jgi:hypothetical protein
VLHSSAFWLVRQKIYSSLNFRRLRRSDFNPPSFFATESPVPLLAFALGQVECDDFLVIIQLSGYGLHNS